LERDPEKWAPVSRLREAASAGEGKSEKIMLKRKIWPQRHRHFALQRSIHFGLIRLAQ
jgi:hypothetical protein